MIVHIPTEGIMAELGMTSESATAEELGMTEPTLAKMRKQGRAPEHTVIARKIYYTRQSKRRWIEAGGERQYEELAPTKRLGRPPKQEHLTATGNE